MLLVLLRFAGASGLALEITFEGKTYGAVEVSAVDGDAVLLETKRGEITVSRKSLTWQVEAAVREFEKRSEVGQVQPRRPSLGETPRAWILGPVGSQSEGGITVISSEYFVRQKVSRSGRASDAQAEKDGAPAYTGTIFVRGVQQKPESSFDRVLWRDGFAVVDGQRMPAFTRVDPGPVAIPDFTGERIWKNAEGKEMTAVLKSLQAEMGSFVRPDGRKFVYDIRKLSAPDQAFIREALAQRARQLEQLRRDHPGQKLADLA